MSHTPAVAAGPCRGEGVYLHSTDEQARKYGRVTLALFGVDVWSRQRPSLVSSHWPASSVPLSRALGCLRRSFRKSAQPKASQQTSLESAPATIAQIVGQYQRVRPPVVLTLVADKDGANGINLLLPRSPSLMAQRDLKVAPEQADTLRGMLDEYPGAVCGDVLQGMVVGLPRESASDLVYRIVSEVLGVPVGAPMVLEQTDQRWTVHFARD